MQAVKALRYSNEEVTRYPQSNREGKCRDMKEKVSYKNVTYRFLCAVKYLLLVFTWVDCASVMLFQRFTVIFLSY